MYSENDWRLYLSHSDEEIDKHKYGIPQQKKFPLPDADHVRSAIRFFNYVDPKYEKELASAIIRRMKEYGLSFDDFTVGDENRFKKYVPECELYHYGIQGQKWGVRNGPPYPLNPDSRKRMYKQHKVGVNEYPKFTKKDQLLYLKEHPIEKLSDMDRIESSRDKSSVRFAINHNGTKNGHFFNCSNCATAFEMTERGYDVVARPKANGSNVENIESFFKGGMLYNAGVSDYDYAQECGDLFRKWKKEEQHILSLEKRNITPDQKVYDHEDKAFTEFDKKHQQVAAEAEKSTIASIVSQGEGSRGIIVVGWREHYDPSKRTTAFHAQNYIYENGEITFYDAQSKHDYSGYKNTDWLSKDCDPREIYIMQTNNLKLSDTVGEAVISRGKS